MSPEEFSMWVAVTAFTIFTVSVAAGLVLMLKRGTRGETDE
jgi:hypothetical protein